MDSPSLVPFGEAISVTAGGICSTAKPGHLKITLSQNMKRCGFCLGCCWGGGGLFGFLFFQITHLEFVSVFSYHFSFETTNP